MVRVVLEVSMRYIAATRHKSSNGSFHLTAMGNLRARRNQ